MNWPAGFGGGKPPAGLSYYDRPDKGKPPEARAGFLDRVNGALRTATDPAALERVWAKRGGLGGALMQGSGQFL
jgi:hypothetical protein